MNMIESFIPSSGYHTFLQSQPGVKHVFVEEKGERVTSLFLLEFFPLVVVVEEEKGNVVVVIQSSQSQS